MKVGKQIGWGAILSYLNIALGMIITLCYTPFMIRSLGKSEYGLYNTVASTVSSLSILSLGFGSSYVRFFSEYKEKNDEDGISSLNGMFLLVFFFLGLVAAICGTWMLTHLNMIFAEGIVGEELSRAKILMILMVIQISVSFPASVFTSIITANEEFIFQKAVAIFQQVGGPVLCIPILIGGKGSIGMVIGLTSFGYLINLLNVWFVLSKMKVRFSFYGIDWSILLSIAVYSGAIALNLIVDQINLNIDKILLGRFRGTMSVAVYSVGFTLYHFYLLFSTSISNVFTPRIHRIWSNEKASIEKKDKQLSELFAAVGRVQLMVLLLVISGIVLFGRQFIGIWAGKGYENAYYVVLILGISAIVPLTQNVGIEIQRAKNKHYFRSIIYSLMAFINLTISIILCQRYGEIGSAIGTAISFLFANIILMNIYYNKKLNITISLYWKHFLRILVAATPAFFAGAMICKYYDTYHVTGMIKGIVLYSIVYIICVYLFGVDSREKSIIQEWMGKK